MILCCGEALIDMLPRESTAGEPAFAPYAGGAVFNTAVALGRLRVPVGFFSGLSSDLFGQQLREVLAASHVGADYAAISDRPTTLAFVRLVDGHASYAFYDENTAGRMLSQDDLPALADDVNAMLFGAISLTVFATYLSGLSNTAFTATQYALLSSVAAVARTFATTPSGIVADRLGFTGFYVFCAFLGTPGLVFLYFMRREGFVVETVRQKGVQGSEAEPSGEPKKQR